MEPRCPSLDNAQNRIHPQIDCFGFAPKSFVRFCRPNNVIWEDALRLGAVVVDGYWVATRGGLAAADKQEADRKATLESIRRISRDKFVLIYFAGPSPHFCHPSRPPIEEEREPFFVDKERIELEA